MVTVGNQTAYTRLDLDREARIVARGHAGRGRGRRPLGITWTVVVGPVGACLVVSYRLAGEALSRSTSEAL